MYKLLVYAKSTQGHEAFCEVTLPGCSDEDSVWRLPCRMLTCLSRSDGPR